MDPQETLRIIRELNAMILRMIDNERQVPQHLVAELAENVQHLDSWLSKGGYSPWQA